VKSISLAPGHFEYWYKRPRRVKTCGGVFGGVFALESFVNQKWDPGKVVVLKHTILSQLPDSERKAVFSTTLWRVVGVVPGGAQKSSGGWCEGSNPPQGMPGDQSWLTLVAVWPDGRIAQWNMLAQHLHANGTKRGPKFEVLNSTIKLVSQRRIVLFSFFFCCDSQRRIEQYS